MRGHVACSRCAGLRLCALFAPAADVSPVALAEGLTLRNERLELTVSKKTGGIQSIRTHRDRSTRVSQRLVFHHEVGAAAAESQMVAEPR